MYNALKRFATADHVVDLTASFLENFSEQEAPLVFFAALMRNSSSPDMDWEEEKDTDRHVFFAMVSKESL